MTTTTNHDDDRDAIVQVTQPDWDPLLRLAGEDLTATFMWMFEGRTDEGVRLHAYKHIWTRRYVFLDAAGNAYAWSALTGYWPVSPDRALREALEPWWAEGLGASAADRATALAAIDRAAQAA